MTAMTLQMILKAEGAQAAKAAVDGVKQSTDGLTGATTRGATADRGAASAKQASARAATQLTSANRQAAGATGNLVAQFNDIGMMLAAGQNPLQLAIQQGTQITQVIGPMGAAGAANALGAAFLGMLNPLSLVTLGVIAAAGYTTSWLLDGAEDAKSFADSVEELEGQADRYVAAIDRARLSTSELRGEFGDTSLEIRALLKDMAELEMRETQRKARQASEDLQTQIGIFDGPEFGVGNQKNLADMFDLSVWSRDAQKEINSVLNAFQALDNAGTLDEQIAAAETLKARFTEAALASGEISEAEDAVLAPLNQMILTLSRVRGEQAGLTQEVVKTQGEAITVNTIAGEIATTLNSADGSTLAAAFAAAFPAANALLGIAQGIVQTLGASFDFGSLGDDERGSQRLGDRSVGELRSRQAVSLRMASIANPGAGGGGGAAARDEADALQELIASLEEEIAALRESDPVQKELLQHRKAMEGATEAERLKVEELIATRERERAAMEAIQELQQFKEDLVENALDSLITKGESLKQVLDQVIIALMKAVVQAAIFGSGPLSGLFSGKGIGALLFGPGKAEGGMVYGPGDGSEDTFLTPTANGEFIVNARATAKNRHLLEAINAGGQVRGYAAGGMVGADNRRFAARDEGGGDIHIHNHLAGAKGDREIEALARKGTQAALKDYDRNAAPSTVRRVSSDPRRIG